MLDKNLAADVLNAALSTGGDFAEIFVENTHRNNITMVNNIVEKAISGVTFGCGIRVFSGFGAIYGFTNDLSRESLIKLGKEVSTAAKMAVGRKPLSFVNTQIENAHKIEILPENAVLKDIVDQLKIASNASLTLELVTQTVNSYLDVTQDVLIANSEGLWAADRRVRTRVMVSAIATRGNEKQTGHFGPGKHMGLEIFNHLDMERLGLESAEIAVTMLNADECPAGKMPVIIENGFGGVIFHEACGHGLEATAVAKGASVFADKMGKQIASPLVTAIDDGTTPNGWGSQNIDDEGNKTQKNILIENGILKSFMVDKLNGLRMSMESTGSARRESYKFPPTSRMTNTYIAPGKDNPDDIIKNTEYGLYAKKMGGGSVSPATGEFNFAVLEGYLVKNGKIVKPVRGATLIGKGNEVLMNIDMVGNNLAEEQGMCGSISGHIPTNVGQPMIRVKELTVGGRG